jgi:ribosomal protein L16 Arg81 hydroxylase
LKSTLDEKIYPQMMFKEDYVVNYHTKKLLLIEKAIHEKFMNSCENAKNVMEETVTSDVIPHHITTCKVFIWN